MNYLFLQSKIKTKTFIVSEQFSHSCLPLITVTKTSLLNELLNMTMHRDINVHHEHISIARKTLIFKGFSLKLYQRLSETKKINLSCTGCYKF